MTQTAGSQMSLRSGSDFDLKVGGDGDIQIGKKTKIKRLLKRTYAAAKR